MDLIDEWARAQARVIALVAPLTAEQAAELVTAMDGLNMRVMVNLSGGSGERFQKGQANLGGRHPSRFVQFVETLPMTATGKVLRRELRSLG